MALPNKNEVRVESGEPGDSKLYLRQNAEYILRSTEQLDRKLNHRSLPIAGLRSAVLTEQGVTKEVTPREVLNPMYRPVVIFDLDNTVWPHTSDLLKAISHEMGVEGTEEDLLACGHTLKIPQWQTPEFPAIHQAIQANRHPEVNPFVNKAYQEAVETVHAVHAMGHLYTYFTGRMSEMFDITKRVIEWNGLPLDPSTRLVDARTHDEPKLGYLYCSSVDTEYVNEYKNAVVNSWRRNLRSAGWRGNMIIVDDTPKAFKDEIENGDVVAISLDGPLNHNFAPFRNEVRVDDWYKISEFLKHYHGKALADDPSPMRVFDCGPELPDMQIEVRKDVSGPGHFRFEALPRGAYSFVSKKTEAFTS